ERTEHRSSPFSCAGPAMHLSSEAPLCRPMRTVVRVWCEFQAQTVNRPSKTVKQVYGIYFAQPTPVPCSDSGSGIGPCVPQPDSQCSCEVHLMYSMVLVMALGGGDAVAWEQ